MGQNTLYGRRERERGRKLYEKAMAENFPYLGGKNDTQIQEGQHAITKMNKRNPL